MSKSVTNYRWIVFILALGYFLYQFTQTSLGDFGWQFRYLTIWGLTANMIAAWIMLRLSLGKSDRSHNDFISAATVLGAVVVFMYWRLYFIDPALVNGGGPIVWYQEYYLHLLGPILMWIDAFFILGVFRQIRKTLGYMALLFLGYIAWVELAVHPLNDTPVGKVTSGLPYPFMNDMDLSQRLQFYATSIVTALVIAGVFWLIAVVLRRIQSA